MRISWTTLSSSHSTRAAPEPHRAGNSPRAICYFRTLTHVAELVDGPKHHDNRHQLSAELHWAQTARGHEADNPPIWVDRCGEQDIQAGL
jgi:hypothetical protein